eukprot:symbB.v1.2.037304.t1/scaffold5473.1/size26756/2
MASPLGDSFPFRNPLAESAASIPSLPVTPGGFPALLDAARQQTELVFWIVRTVQEHEGKLQSLSRQLADQLSVTKLLSEDRKTFRSSKSRNWQAGLGNRGLSRESFNSMDGPGLSQGASSPTDIIDTVEDKTHIEENLGDIAHNLTDKDDEALMPVDGVTTQKEDQVEEEEAPQEGRVSQMDSIGEDREELPQDSTARVSGSVISAESPPARRFSFIEGSLLTEERFADRLEERLQQVLAEDVEHRLEDLAQYIQEEMYHFVLGPDMMERVRQEASNVLSIEMAVALAAQDKKMEDLVHSRVQSSLSEVTLTPEIPPEALSSLQQASEELNELADGLSKRVKLVEENGLRLQVPDMRNDIDTLQSNLAVCVQSIEELEVQQQELIAAGAKPSRNASPTRQLLSPSGSAADEVTAEDLAEHPEVQPVAVPEPISSPVPSPSQMVREASPETVKPKRRLSDMLGVYMPPAPKQPALEDSQVQELVASTENMKNRLDQMEHRRNSLQNKINDVDTLASILEDRMRELDNEFRSNHQKVQSQLDVLLAAHETQQAEDLRHNKTWNLANQAKWSHFCGAICVAFIQRRSFGEIDPGSSGVETTSWPGRAAAIAAGALATSVVGALSLSAWSPPGKEIGIDIKPITDEVFDNNDNLFVFYFDTVEDLKEKGEDLRRIMDALVKEPSLDKVKYYQNVRKEGCGHSHGADDTIRVVIYKGQRKKVLFIGGEIPKQEARKDTCFLCFLMRPFVNSLGEFLEENKAPFVVKRINIEKNDFPEGTPTFVLFRGPDVRAEKWEEFKPKDLCEKMVKVFPKLSVSDSVVLLDAANFQDRCHPISNEDNDFNSILQQLMARDMRRVDGMEENLAFLQKQVEEAEV